MGQVLWTEPALDDLREILAFIARDSPAYAARLGNRLIEAPRN
jgi:plasmid stabilization system protein ParE